MSEASLILKAVSEALAKVAEELEGTEVTPAPKAAPKKAAATATRKKKAATVKAEEPAEEPAPEEKPAEAAPVTLEQIRSVLQEKRAEGKKDKFKELFATFGVQRLPDVDPADYADLLAAAEAL